MWGGWLFLCVQHTCQTFGRDKSSEFDWINLFEMSVFFSLLRSKWHIYSSTDINSINIYLQIMFLIFLYRYHFVHRNLFVCTDVYSEFASSSSTFLLCVISNFRTEHKPIDFRVQFDRSSFWSADRSWCYRFAACKFFVEFVDIKFTTKFRHKNRAFRRTDVWTDFHVLQKISDVQR